VKRTTAPPREAVNHPPPPPGDPLDEFRESLRALPEEVVARLGADLPGWALPETGAFEPPEWPPPAADEHPFWSLDDVKARRAAELEERAAEFCEIVEIVKHRLAAERAAAVPPACGCHDPGAPGALEFLADGLVTPAISGAPGGGNGLTFRPGGFVYRGVEQPLMGKPLAVLRSFAESPDRTRTAKDLHKLLYENETPRLDDTIRSHVSKARGALRQAIRKAGVAFEDDPLPCIDRGKGALAWRLAELPEPAAHQN
jgi:hypothetical protein